MSRPVAIPVGYFGKIPTRADFVKASENAALSSMLDAWLAQAIDLLSADARWKRNYDALAPINLATRWPATWWPAPTSRAGAFRSC
jgi:type VI secretion system protein ImpM